MENILIYFLNVKNELFKLKELYKNTRDKKLLIKMEKLESKLINKKNIFIKEFRLNNVSEIKKYLDIKN